MLADRFDKIFVLTMSSRRDRQTGIFNMLKSIGYDPENISHLRKLETVYATPWPYNEVITYYMNRAFSRKCFTKPNEYDCTRNHYGIIRRSLDLGYEKILVIEDDVRFLKPEYLSKMIEGIPENFDIVRFNGFTASQSAFNFIVCYNQGVSYIKNPATNLWTTGCYGLSRKGMEYYIHYINERLAVADYPFYAVPESLDYYVATLPVAIQADKDEVPSDIRSKETDRIDYNRENCYEAKIDKTWYLEYKIYENRS